MMYFLLFLLMDISARPVSTQEAKSAVVIPTDTGVQVLLEEPGKVTTGFIVTVPQPSKFIRLKAQKDLFTVISPTKLNDNEWYFPAPPGIYAVTVTQFDPESGIDEQYLRVVIDGKPIPEEPGPDPPVTPSPGMEGVLRVAGLAPKDVVTTELLIQLYRTETEPARVFELRKAIMRSRDDQATNWNPFIVAFNEELAKVDYVSGLRYLADALEKRITVNCINGTCYRVMN